MKKIIAVICLCFMITGSAFAKVAPQEVQDYINSEFPNTNFRFDGAIILPDNTMYIPLEPAKLENSEKLDIKSSYPVDMQLKQKPDMIIFSNNYILLKVVNSKGKKTIINISPVPDELKSALLPQDLLVPKGLVIPENLKAIIGDLDVEVAQENGLRINNSLNKVKKSTIPVDLLKDKTFYISTGVNKNIQVVDSTAKNSQYALKQDFVINDIKAYNNEFLLVTYFDTKLVNIISLMDEKVIKQVKLEAVPEQVIIDKENKVAYLTCGETSSIYVLSLETMNLKRQLKVNGQCEKFTLSEDGTKLFYVDRKTNTIWAIELDNKYLLKNIGKFPNVAKITYANGKLYIISRTKNRLAIVDYETLEPLAEIEVGEKPVDLFVKGDDLYILCAQDNVIEVMDTKDDTITDKLFLNTNAFATNMISIDDSNLVMITNALSGLYSVLDTDVKAIVNTTPIELPIRQIAITNKVKTIK